MHRRLGVLLLLGAPLLGCSSVDLDTGSGGSSGDDSSTQGGHVTGTAGSTSGGGNTAAGGNSGVTGGSGGGSVTITAGAGSTDPCNGVPSNGVCVDAHTVEACQLPSVGSNDPPVIHKVTCESYEACSADPKGGASCKLATACEPNAVQCSADSKSVETCKADGSGFADVACGNGQLCEGNPGQVPACVDQLSGSATDAQTLSGCVTFEAHGLSVSGVASSTEVAAGILQFIAVYNGTDYVGSAVTDAGSGCFTATLTAPVTAATTVYVYALDFDPDTGNPLIGVVHNDANTLTSFESTNGYWHWSNQDPAAGSCAGINELVNVDPAGHSTIGTMDHDGDGQADILIPECEGSGALRVFQWVRFGMVRFSKDHHGLDQIGPGEVVHSTEGIHQPSLAVFWEPGIDAQCGACFVPGSLGGATVDLGSGQTPDHFDTMMEISGSDQNPTQWSYSVLSHEFGHYVMAAYSKPPGEGGVHYVSEASKPGLAYSEGWATSFGQFNVSTPVDDATIGWDPVYIDTQDGTTFFVNIDAGAYSGGGLDKGNPAGPLDQDINENIVAGMIFKLEGLPQVQNPSDTAGTPGAVSPEDYAHLGAEAIFTGFQSQQLVSGVGRGYPTVDMIDFLDAQKCANVATGAQITTVSGPAGYPWDGGQCL